jgi:hypothetical protein
MLGRVCFTKLLHSTDKHLIRFSLVPMGQKRKRRTVSSNVTLAKILVFHLGSAKDLAAGSSNSQAY